MTIFEKCDAYTLAREVQAMGIYPYFTPIEETTATEARIGGEWKIMVGSNNYLGLTHHPKVLEAARRAAIRYGVGSTGSRFLNGTLDLHYELESRLAAFFNKEAALVFTTGYQASLGVLGPLLGRNDHAFLDRLDHASLVDGARLGVGEMHRYAHGDFDGLARQLARSPRGAGKLVVTDGVFSMEGTIVDLPRLVAVSKDHGAAILVDEAHAVGVLGDDGAGTVSHFGLSDQVDLILATFSKSLASIGGVVAGP
jgi:8-amino-7-oxononanoate synthase